MEGNSLSICGLFLKTHAEETKPNAFPEYMPAEIVHNLNLDLHRFSSVEVLLCILCPAL